MQSLNLDYSKVLSVSAMLIPVSRDRMTRFLDYIGYVEFDTDSFYDEQDMYRCVK